MAARATSSGTISFGLVSIPVKVYTASSSKTVRFSMLHSTDKSRLKQTYVCRSCDEPVERGDTVRGYEYARDQYVVLEEEELKALEQQSDHTIDIEEFVPISKVDPIYFEKSNLLGPDKGGQKAYRLLAQAMVEAGRVAIGRYNARGRQQLVLLRPSDAGPDGASEAGHALVMHGLYYLDEVRSFEDIELGDNVEFKTGELDLAHQLIEQLSQSKFEPGKYEDEYRRSVLEAVDRKVAGEEVVVMPTAEPREQIIDLVAALKRSLEGETRSTAKTSKAAGVKSTPARKPAKGKAQSRKKASSAAGKSKIRAVK